MFVIRSNNSLLRVFDVESDVRQDSTLSPSIFIVLMNAFIVNLRLLDVFVMSTTNMLDVFCM